MGTAALNRLKDEGFVYKNLSTKSLRGKKIESPEGGYWLVTYDPYVCETDMKLNTYVQWDVRLARRLVETGSLNPDIGVYNEVQSFAPLIEQIQAEYKATGERVDVALDLETMGFYPWYADKHILSISFTYKRSYSDVKYFMPGELPSAELRQQIKWLTSSPMVTLIGANLKFDNIWMYVKWGIPLPTNMRFDTLVVGSLLDENRSNSLNTHAKLMTQMGGYDDEFNGLYDKGHMELVPRGPLIEYAGGDTDACWQSKQVLKNQILQDPALANFYVNLLHPATRVFEPIELRGVVIDYEKYDALHEVITSEIVSLNNDLIELTPNRVRLKHAKNLKFSRPVVIRDIFFSSAGWNLKPKEFTDSTRDLPPEKQVPKTTHDHLKKFSTEPEAKDFIAKKKELGVASKIASTYIGEKEDGVYTSGFLSHLRPDGLFHPTYNLFAGSMYGGDGDDAGAVTGRTSAKNPAIQTLPKRGKWAKHLRKCFVAPKGHYLFQIDYSQGELKITACLANEKTMLKAYIEGVDLHAMTGARLANMPLEELLTLETTDPDKYEMIRYRAKAPNFGLIYGMEPPGYQSYTYNNYDLILTDTEAVEQHAAFFTLYSGLKPWHKEYKAFAKNNGFVRSPLGRVRHLPLIHSSHRKVSSTAERQAINSPVQGTLSDMCVWAIALCEKEMANDGLWIAGMTHDSIWGYTPIAEAHDQINRIAHIMSNLPLEETFGWKPQLQFTVDAEIGDNLAELEKLPLAA